MNYLTMLIISYPFISSNNMGEDGLQLLTTSAGFLSLLSSYSGKDAVRTSMAAQGARCHRTRDEQGRLRFGPDRSLSMSDGGSPEGWDDGAFGGMAAAKKVKGEKVSPEGDFKLTSAIQMTPGVSTTYATHDRSFNVGVKAALEKGEQVKAIHQREMHFTRVVYSTTVKIEQAIRQGLGIEAFFNAFRFLEVGGGHTSHASEVSPEIIAWRFHKVPGRGGLYLSPGTQFPTDSPIDLKPLHDKAANLGFTFEAAGVGTGRTVNDAIETIIRDVKAIADKA